MRFRQRRTGPPQVTGQTPAMPLRRACQGASRLFTKRLREPIKRGAITSSVRIWQRPRVKEGGRYKLDDGHIVVDRILPIGFEDITPDLARATGFAGTVDLLKTAKHGAGEQVFLVDFHFIAHRH
jgi:hypothetical protein